MRSLVFGGTGMLGGALVAAARGRGWAALALSHAQGDITDETAVRYWVSVFRPEVVFNCAAFTRVDDCQERREHALAVNGAAVGHLVAAAADAGAALVQVSTDYVFDGEASSPYGENAPTRPLSVYGESKLRGEEEALSSSQGVVVRSSWLFGPGGPNFVTTMIRLIEEQRTPLRIVEDQLGCPTYTPFLAEALCDVAASGERGVFHYRNREPVSWYDFAREIAWLWDAGTPVEAITTTELPRPAPRPAYSVLGVDRYERLVGRKVEPWGWGLAEYLAELRRERHPRRGASTRSTHR